MDREYAKPLDAPAMARAALMSPSQFSRQFRAAYGETPYSYLITRAEISRSLGLPSSCDGPADSTQWKAVAAIERTRPGRLACGVTDEARLQQMIDELRQMRERCEPKSNHNPRCLHYSNSVSALRWLVDDLASLNLSTCSALERADHGRALPDTLRIRSARISRIRAASVTTPRSATRGVFHRESGAALHGVLHGHYPSWSRRRVRWAVSAVLPASSMALS